MPPADRLRRKLTVRAHGRTLVLVKRAEERGEHVVQKALLWVRYLPRYPGLRVEQRLPFPSRYTPDLYALDAAGQGVAFWGECGVVSAEKLRTLLRAHRRVSSRSASGTPAWTCSPRSSTRHSTACGGRRRSS